MMIDSHDELLAFAADLLDHARNNLAEDDCLNPVVVMYGEDKQIELDMHMPEQFLNGLMRQFARQDNDLEIAAFVSLGFAVKSDSPTLLVSPAESPDRQLVICVHVSHRDFGAQTVSVSVRRTGPKQFEFGEPCWAKVVMHNTMLDNIWVKPHLNS